MIKPRRPTPYPAIEARLAARLAGALSEANQSLGHDITERLRVAREQALACARLAFRPVVPLRPAAASVVVAAGSAAALGGSPAWWQRAASVVPLALLLVGLMMIERHAQLEQVHVAAEIDSQLLADALPPDAYSDPGFAEFLRRPPP